MSATMYPATDLWHHYGRDRADIDRAVPDTFAWAWGQDSGPGAELLGDLAGLFVADLGSGAGRHAAHLAVHHRPARVDAIDSSPAQHALATGLYGHLPRLRLVHADVVPHLYSHRGRYDVLYSVFGAACFTDPRRLLPAAASALRPGGLLVISTLAHYANGAPAEPGVVHADIPARTPDGQSATMRRWVLQGHVWEKLAGQAGFVAVTAEVLPATQAGPRAADTLLLRAHRAA